MSSSPEAGLTVLPLPELRVGRWTRLGGDSVLGDPVTESLLGGIAAQARDSARAQGYAVGWAEGRRAAVEQAEAEQRQRAVVHAEQEVRREAEHRAAIDALGLAAEQVKRLLAGLAARVEDQATEVAWAVTREVLGHAVASVGAPDVVARVLQVLPPAPVGRVRLHPSVAASPAVQELTGRGLEVVADAGLGPADSLVESADGAVTDLRVDEAMARVRAVLQGDGESTA
jgi:flagellar assembly protein FliH